MEKKLCLILVCLFNGLAGKCISLTVFYALKEFCIKFLVEFELLLIHKVNTYIYEHDLIWIYSPALLTHPKVSGDSVICGDNVCGLL